MNMSCGLMVQYFLIPVGVKHSSSNPTGCKGENFFFQKISVGPLSLYWLCPWLVILDQIKIIIPFELMLYIYIYIYIYI